MASLADQVLSAQKGPSSELEVDDMGFLVERDINERPMLLCRYLLYRILRKHGRPYLHNGVLFIGNGSIGQSSGPDKNFVFDVYRLMDYPGDAKLSRSQTLWIYNRLLELAYRRKDSVILVAKNMVFNMNKGEFEELSDD